MNECTRAILIIRLRCNDLGLPDGKVPNPLANDTQGVIGWSKSTTTKGMKHLNLRDNFAREAVLHEDVNVYHVPGSINPSDFFTKELRDKQHLSTLCDSFMSSLSDILENSLDIPKEDNISHMHGR